MASVADLFASDTEPKAFRLNERQLAFLVSLGEIKGGKLSLAIDTLVADLLTRRERSSSAELEAQFDKMIAAKASDLTDGIGTLSFSGAEIIKAGFPVSALKNINYWRAYQSAASRVVLAKGWLPSLATRLNETDGTMSVVVTFVNGPAAEKGLAKMRTQHVEAAATIAAAKAAKAAAGEDSSDDSDEVSEE